MNTKSYFPTKATLLVVFATFAFACASAEQPGVPSFVEIGKRYFVNFAGLNNASYQVKVLTSGGAGWFKVSATVNTARSVDAPEPEPFEMWINFAQVATVTELKDTAQRSH